MWDTIFWIAVMVIVVSACATGVYLVRKENETENTEKMKKEVKKKLNSLLQEMVISYDLSDPKISRIHMLITEVWMLLDYPEEHWSYPPPLVLPVADSEHECSYF